LYEIEVVGEERLTSEVVKMAVEKQTRLVCIGALPPNGLVKSRYLCKRLRGVSPKPKIVVEEDGDLQKTRMRFGTL
jgi:hypothetical protein